MTRLPQLCIGILATAAVLALAAPWLPLPDPAVTQLDQRLLPWFSDGHLLGTDLLGRDQLARLLAGLRLSLAAALAATLLALTVGSILGIVAGYKGGRTDGVIMRGIDFLMAFPYLILALAIVATLGPGLLNGLAAIAIVNIPFFARTTRGVTVGLAHQSFVEAARLSGRTHFGILRHEILPNVLPTIIVTGSTTFGWMLLETAGLSFLGLGAQAPQADLGSLLADGRQLMLVAPGVALLPGLIILILVLALNLLGDHLRDRLDPRLRHAPAGAPGAATTVTAPPSDKLHTSNFPLLNCTALRIAFNGQPTVKGVSFTLERGQTLGLVGESGSGKSVTALALARLVASPPGVITGGAIRFDGQDVLAATPAQLRALRGRRIAYIFQNPRSTLNPLLTLATQVGQTLRAHQGLTPTEARERAASLFTEVGLTPAADYLDRHPHELSGGQRQRVVIAMALANSADLIIADEPTTALDATVQKKVIDLLLELQKKRNLTLLFISHDLGVVKAVCHQLIVLRHGEVVEAGPTAEVLTNPQHPYTQDLVSKSPRL
ncbi:MAG: dipeptide/oligopeptide/nickel ABC transporter permease/ATP-binding protein [Verrucomicrobiota bacterium]